MRVIGKPYKRLKMLMIFDFDLDPLRATIVFFDNKTVDNY